MIKTTRRSGLAILALVTMVALAGLVIGCSGDETTTTSQDVSATTTESTKTALVGGKTPEEYEADLPALEAAVQASPEDLDALQQLAIAQYWTDRFEEAATTYQKMLAIQDDPFTQNNYGNVLRKLGKIDEAKAQYQQALDADPTLAVAYINMARILSEQGDTEGALEILDSALDKVSEEDKTSLQSYIDQIKTTAATATTATE